MTTTKHWTQDSQPPAQFHLMAPVVQRAGGWGEGRERGCHSQATGPRIRGRKVGLLAHGRHEQIQNVQKCSEQLGTQESGQE